MASLLDMTVRLGADTKQYKRALNQASKDTSTWSKQVGSAMSGLGGIMAGAFSVAAVFEFGKASVQAFNEAELAGAKLQTALKGREESYSRLVKLAADLQRATLFDDDATVEAMSFLAQMQLTEKQIKELIPLVQDFAQAQNMDLANAAKMVGKSVVGSAMAMKKLGFEVKGAEGSAERFTSVMSVLNQAVGGQAEAAAKAGIGAVTQMSNSWGDFMEKVGSVITPGLNDIAKGLNAIMDIQASTDLTFWEKLAALFNPTGAGIAGALAKSEGNRQSANNEQEKTIEQLQKEAEGIITLINLEGQNADFKKQLSDQYNEIQDRIRKKTAEQQKEIDAINAQKAAEKALYDQQVAIRNSESSGVSALPKIGAQDLGGFSTENSINNPNVIFDPGKLEAIATQSTDIMRNLKDDWADVMIDLNSIIISSLNEMAANIASGLGEAMATGNFKGLMNSFLLMIADFLSQFGKLLIAYGIGLEALKKSLTTMNPFAAIAAGASLLVVAGLIRGLMKKQEGAMAMADGGIAFGPTTALIGEYAGANSNPEVVAPLSDLKSMLTGIGGSGDVTVKGRLVGADIMISNERSSYQRNRVRGF